MANFASEFVFVVFWTGLVGVSVLFGDVFRAFNPWRAIGRAVAWVGQTAARGPLPAPPPIRSDWATGPPWPGSWRSQPWSSWLSGGSKPENVAIATLVYSGLTFVAMALYGVDAWVRRGEAFGVYFNLFSRVAPITREGRLGSVGPCRAWPRGNRCWARCPCWR